MNMNALRHPLEVQDYTIPTEAIEVMANTVYQWVDIMLPGGIIYGNPRVGKTFAINYIIPEIPRIFNSNIPAFHYLCSDTMAASEARFYEELLTMVQHALVDKGNAGQKRTRFVNYLIESAREENEYRVLLFVDDAHFLKDFHYHWLMDVHNRLIKKKIRLIVILVGEKHLISLKRSIRSSGRRQILGRFMACTHHFSGLRSLDELKRFLRGYDEGSEFPEGSGITYTQHYVPKAYENGWRLADQAELIWQSLDESLVSTGVSYKELPMQPLAILAHQLLKDLAVMEIDQEDFGLLQKETVLDAIEYSCLTNLIEYCNAPDPS